jgi:hypothetical protein
LLKGDTDERRTAVELLAHVEEAARGLVNWQALAATEYEIPPEYIAASPRAEARKLRKLWRLWKSP